VLIKNKKTETHRHLFYTFLKIPGHMFVPAREPRHLGGLQQDHLLPTAREGQRVFWQIKGGESSSTTCAPWELPCARARRPLCSHRGQRVGNRWQDSGRWRAEGLRDTTTKRRIKVQREYRQ